MYIDVMSVLRERIEKEPKGNHVAELSSLERVFTGGALCLPQTFTDLLEMFPNVKITVPIRTFAIALAPNMRFAIFRLSFDFSTLLKYSRVTE